MNNWITEHLTFGKIYMRRTQEQIMDCVLKESKRLAGKQSYDYLWDKTLHCKEPGVSDKRLCEEEIIVSLTSFGNRIYDVHLAIESIMQQTVKPNRIILWLAKNEFKGKTMPAALRMQQERGLEIAFCEDLKSYKKLILSLQRFPESCIITIDDDAAYHPDVVEKMVNAHQDKPHDICASRMHRVVLGDDGKPIPYVEWQFCVDKCPENNRLAFFTTGGGVLFPPHCFMDEVFNKDVFLDDCGTADDVWFNAMRLLNDVNVTKVYSSHPEGDYTELPSSMVEPLSLNNIHVGNDKAISSVYGRYGLFEKLTEI